MKKRSKVKIRLALLMSAAIVSGHAVAFDIAGRNGKFALPIVIANKASPSEQYAAEELRDFTERMTGAKPLIVTDAEPLPAQAVVIGETKFTKGLLGTINLPEMGEDGYALVATSSHLLVVGSSKRGALFGVYGLLEKYGGCRWYSADCAKIPTVDSFRVPANLKEVEIPTFAMREPLWFDLTVHHAFATRLRTNVATWSGTQEKFGGSSFRFGGGLVPCHTFRLLVPPSKYGKEHPEYFSLVKGQRLCRDETGQLCLSNPEVLEIVIARVREAIESSPEARLFGVSQNDNLAYCECRKCAATDAEEGSHAGSIVRFVNAVAERIETEYPDVKLVTLAYTYSRKPPKKTRLRHNVIPCLCTIECDFAHPIATGTNPSNVSFREDINGWAKMCDNIYIWDYVTNFRYFLLAFPNCNVLQENLRFFRDHNVKEVFAQGCSNGPHAEFAELKAWLLAKWMWNPELPRKELLDDFFDGYYGKSAPYVRKYFEELQRRQTAAARSIHIDDARVDPAFDDRFFADTAKCWQLAEAAVKDDPMRLHHVRMGSLSADFTRFLRDDKILVFGSDGDADPMARCRLAKSILKRMGESNPPILLCEGSDYSTALREKLDEASRAPRPIATSRGTVEEKDLTTGYLYIWSNFEDDPDAEDGRALKMFNLQYSYLTARIGFSSFKFEPGVKYTLRARIKVLAKSGCTGEAFRCGICRPNDSSADHGLILAPKVTEVMDGYQWYEIGAFVPDPEKMFWMSPGVFDENHGEKTSIEGVWIDKLEFVREPK